MRQEGDISLEELRATMFQFLVYTAKSLGQTKDNPSELNELELDPASLLLMAYLFCFGTPKTIYELAKGNRIGSYRTVRRRLQQMEADGIAEQTADDRWQLSETGTEYVAGYAKVLLTMPQRVAKLLDKRRSLRSAAE